MMKPHGSWISGISLLATSVVLALAALATPSTQAQTYTKTILHDFTGGNDGSNPFTRVIVDKAGNLYGVTGAGGLFNNGTIFKVDSSGSETVLYTFTEPVYGTDPVGRLTMDAAGNLYGNTQQGGTYGYGTVFELDTSGTYTVLHHFIGGPEGEYPQGGLLLVGAGFFVGSTSEGGETNCNNTNQGCGIVFRLAPNSDGGWTFTVLHVFAGPPDGAYPVGELTRDSHGNFYGATQQGGDTKCFNHVYGCGTVFKVHDREETVLYRFTGKADGLYPSSGLLMDSAGNLYGTTYDGGTGCIRNHGCGTVYKLDESGHESVLYTFKGGADGRFPDERLVTDPAGNLYGTTSEGGERPYSGTVYKVDTTGTETVLYNFLGGADGRFPYGLAIDAAGNLYGVTEEGGLNDCERRSSCGTVFKLTPQ